MGKGSAWSDDSDRHSAAQVTEANNEADAETAVAGILRLLPGVLKVCDLGTSALELISHDNCDDDSVNSDGLTENNRYQVFRNQSRHFHCWTHNASACDEDAPKQVDFLTLTMLRQ